MAMDGVHGFPWFFLALCLFGFDSKTAVVKISRGIGVKCRRFDRAVYAVLSFLFVYWMLFWSARISFGIFYRFVKNNW